MALVGKAAVVWLGLALCAVLNGALREAVLVPSLGAGVARPLSAGLLVLVVLALTSLLIRWQGPFGPGRALAVGAGWVAATLTFETGMGLLQGRPAAEIVGAYDPLAPTLWFWVVVVILLAPLVVGRLRR